MPSTSVGGYLGPKNRDPEERRPHVVKLTDPNCSVDDGRATDPGFTRDQAKIYNQRFIEQLRELSENVRDRENEPPDADLEEQQRLEQAIRFTETECETYLRSLREVGAEFRSKFSLDFNRQLESVNFSNAFMENNNDPGFNFLEAPSARSQEQPPIFWEMMYEGEEIERPEQQKFWGFQIPISHWITQNRPKEFKLQQGLFWATHQELAYFQHIAGFLLQQELGSLKHQLGQFQIANPAYGMTEAFKVCIENELKGKKSATEVQNWLQHHFSQNWFSTLFAILQTDFQRYGYGSTEIDARKYWMMHVLKELFMNTDVLYDLLHFACHCSVQRGRGTQLEMTVGKEMVPMRTSFIHTSLCMKKEHIWDVNTPGPLVFLNACNTTWHPSIEALPEMPEAWINCRGAVAVITTLCPVPNYFACKFAEKFYEILFDAVAKYPQLHSGEVLTEKERRDIYRNRYLADALLATKQFFLKEYHNPLGLAYMLYAVPGVYVSADIRQDIKGVAHA